MLIVQLIVEAYIVLTRNRGHATVGKIQFSAGAELRSIAAGLLVHQLAFPLALVEHFCAWSMNNKMGTIRRPALASSLIWKKQFAINHTKIKNDIYEKTPVPNITPSFFTTLFGSKIARAQTNTGR